jgi:hypothetical protein
MGGTALVVADRQVDSQRTPLSFVRRLDTFHETSYLTMRQRPPNGP